MKRLTVADRVVEVCAWIESGQARGMRERAGLTQVEVARSCDVSQAAVFRWENNERRPRMRHALAYHRVLSRLAARESA